MASGLYFTEIFDLDPVAFYDHGAFNISLVNDLPLFVDPFLLFASKDDSCRRHHDSILDYLRFLRDESGRGAVSDGLLKSRYIFPEVRQNWLGYSRIGNAGSGLGMRFARSLSKNLGEVFSDFGEERISKSSHLEKLCLIEDGVGRDNISDFVVNLAKEYFLRYTQHFARKYVDKNRCREFSVSHVRFDFNLGIWVSGRFHLPEHGGDYVLLTPASLLTRDDTWINQTDLHRQFDQVIASVPNDQLRAELNQYLARQLPKDPSSEDLRRAQRTVLRKHPQLLDHFIKLKEGSAEKARSNSAEQVDEVKSLFVTGVSEMVRELDQKTNFYSAFPNTKEEAHSRLMYFKDFIENKGGHRFFFEKGKPIRREHDLHLMYRLTWYGTPSDVTREANDGRGPVDFKISRGAKDKTLVEFKLASNSQLRRNLEKQVAIYQKASDAKSALKAIVCFSDGEIAIVRGILRDLKLEDCRDVILIDANPDNKPSGSKA